MVKVVTGNNDISVRDWFRQLAHELADVNHQVREMQTRLVRIETLMDVREVNMKEIERELEEARKRAAALAVKISSAGAAASALLPLLKSLLIP